MDEKQLIRVLNQYSFHVMAVQGSVKVKLQNGTVREANSDEKLQYLMEKWFITMSELEDINISLKGRYLS